ncbi:MAG: histone [Chlamydia sp.]
MSLQNTIQEMRELLSAIAVDLEKASNGNKAASQRVRTGTIRLEKGAKKYRKESIHAEKSVVAKKPAKKAAVASKKPQTKVKAVRPKAKAMHSVVKRPTAKIPMKK